MSEVDPLWEPPKGIPQEAGIDPGWPAPADSSSSTNPNRMPPTSSRMSQVDSRWEPPREGSHSAEPRTFPPEVDDEPNQGPFVRSRNIGPWILTLLIIAALVSMVALAIAVFHVGTSGSRNGSAESTPTSAKAEPTTSSATASPSATSPTTRPTGVALPDADNQGFTTLRGARCDGGDVAAFIERTNQLALVVCRSGSGGFYYKGVRLSDSAAIALGNAYPTNGGFDVVNPADGTQYQIRQDGLTIIVNGQVAANEPAVEVAYE